MAPEAYGGHDSSGEVNDRSAILLGKDSMYPAQIAFYLAHELGHIALSHLTADRVIVDLEQQTPSLAEQDVEETAADRFALELLTGDARPTVLPPEARYSARELARVALASAEELKVEAKTSSRRDPSLFEQHRQVLGNLLKRSLGSGEPDTANGVAFQQLADAPTQHGTNQDIGVED